MKVNPAILAAATLALAGIALPLPMAAAHTCTKVLENGQVVLVNPPEPPACDCPAPQDGKRHRHVVIDLVPTPGAAPAVPLVVEPSPVCETAAANPYEFCPHSFPHSHTYGTGGSVGGRSDAATGGDEVGAGIVTVTETNTADCDGDDVPGDFDGDYESGVGGGFFGFGPWAHEATCNYGLRPHGSFVVVTDAVFFSNVFFVIGADDTSGPVVEVDPVDGSTSCSTDGSITPGDPTTDPTADADDCLTDTYQGSGQNTCGGGGDGGYWVFLNGVFVDETGGQVAAAGPTAGTITA